MNRSRFLVVLGANAARWAARYGIEPFSQPCSKCGALLTTSVPFACDSLRGLLAPRCECGNEQTPYCVVREPGSGDLFTGAEARIPKARVATRTASRARLLRLQPCSSDA